MKELRSKISLDDNYKFVVYIIQCALHSPWDFYSRSPNVKNKYLYNDIFSNPFIFIHSTGLKTERLFDILKRRSRYLVIITADTLFSMCQFRNTFEMQVRSK